MGLFDGLFGRGKAQEPREECLGAPAEGSFVALADVADAAFASGALGAGIAVKPSSGVVYAPCDGSIMATTKTMHALGVLSQGGAEVLIHIGIDTVEMDGRGFTELVGMGEQVRKGQPILEFDRDAIAAAGLDDIIMMSVTNSASFTSVEPCASGQASVGADAVRIIQ